MTLPVTTSSLAPLRAVIFDLDGVITDTAEYHYQAWQRLADEEGLPFDREVNERCRGVTRRDSLLIVLGGRPEPEERMQEFMARKQRYYEALLDHIGPDDLLPGVAGLLDQLDAAGLPYAIASASKNARAVCERLGIAARLGMLADGHSVERQKPFPDLFRFAAAGLGVPAARCLVVEDAAAGVAAALSAGMHALALGPADRFLELAPRGAPFTRRDDLRDVTLDELRAAATFDPGRFVVQEGFDPATQHHMETVFTLGNGYFASRGSFEEGYPGESALTFAHGLWDDMPISFTELVNLPRWLHLTICVDGDEFRLDRGELLDFRRTTDLRRGLLRRDVTWRAPNGKVIDLHFERFHAYHRDRLGALRLLATAVSHHCVIEVRAGIDGHVANQDLLHLRLTDQGREPGDVVWLRAATRHTGRDLALAASVSAEMSAGRVPPPLSDLCAGFPALAHRVELGILVGRRLPHPGPQPVPLPRGHHGQPDVAVPAGDDRVRILAAGAAAPGVGPLRGGRLPHRPERRIERQQHRLVAREVDVIATAATQPVIVGDQHRPGRLHGGGGRGDAIGRQHRRAGGWPGARQGRRQRIEHGVGGPPVCPRARRPEVGDRQRDQVPEAVGELGGRGAERRGEARQAGVDQHVGAAGQLEQTPAVRRGARVQDGAALVRVVQGERDGGPGQSRHGGPGGAAAGWLHLEHVGAEVGQDAGDRVAVTARQVEDSKRCQ